MEPLGSPGPLSRLALFVLVGGLALILGLLYFARQLPAAKPVHKVRPAAAAPGARETARSPETTADAVQSASVEELNRAIAAALAVLQDPANPNKAPALEALRAALAGAEPKVAIAAIRQFLAAGQDARTGLRFKVGEGGVLEEAPTLRTFLMDQLGALSGEAHSADAAEVARETLDTKNSADEWAVAMRNLAWNDPAGSKVFLAAKVREMLADPAWQQQPSGGFLEAFDVAAYAGDGSLMGDLAAMAKTPSPVRQAALVALERLSAMAPAQVTSYLNANPGVLAESPLLRADYMGNVDLSDADQQAQAEIYLRRPDVTEAEKEKFLARLATPAGFVSNTLLTPSNIAHGSILEHRAIVNRTAAGWLASGAFPALTAPLQGLVQNTARPSG